MQNKHWNFWTKSRGGGGVRRLVQKTKFFRFFFSWGSPNRFIRTSPSPTDSKVRKGRCRDLRAAKKENQDKITITSGCTAVIGWYCQMMELSAVIPSADEIANALAVAITVALKIFCLDCLIAEFTIQSTKKKHDWYDWDSKDLNIIRYPSIITGLWCSAAGVVVRNSQATTWKPRCRLLSVSCKTCKTFDTLDSMATVEPVDTIKLGHICSNLEKLNPDGLKKG